MGGAYGVSAQAYARALPDLGFEAPADVAWLRRFVQSIVADGGGDLPVLDAGCGTGRLFSPLRAWGLDQVHGIDASDGMLAVARRLHAGVRVRQASIERVPEEDASQAGILAWYSIIHTPTERLGPIAGEFARLLRPGGLTLVAFHSGSGPRPSRFLDSTGTDVLLHPHPVPAVAAALTGAGLELIASGLRAPRADERDAQGFVMARARA